MHRSRGRMWWLQFFAGRGRRLLDVGCNGGFLVEAARERGLEAHGIDIDPVSIDYARAHYPRNTFYCGTVEYQKENLGVFDLIYCSEVIEHVPQAHAFAHSLASVLKPGGFIYLTTPDIHHLRRPKNVNSWNAISDPGHYIFYSRRGLRQLFRSVGIDWVFRFPDPKPGLRVLLKKWK